MILNPKSEQVFTKNTSCSFIFSQNSHFAIFNFSVILLFKFLLYFQILPTVSECSQKSEGHIKNSMRTIKYMYTLHMN